MGLGTNARSPGAVIADAKFAKPSFEPSVVMTSDSGFKETPNLFS